MVSLLILLLPIFCSDFSLDDNLFQKNTQNFHYNTLKRQIQTPSEATTHNPVSPETMLLFLHHTNPQHTRIFTSLLSSTHLVGSYFFFLNRFSKTHHLLCRLYLNSPPALEHCCLRFLCESETNWFPIFLNVDLPFVCHSLCWSQISSCRKAAVFKLKII